MKNFLIIFILGLSISQADILTGTESCGLCIADSHSTCIVGTGCQCDIGYKLKDDSSVCEADTGIIKESTECNAAVGCGEESHATCIVGTGCQCDVGYKLTDDSTACEADTGIITGTVSCTLCQDSHATCTVGTGCVCTTGYQLNEGKTVCVETSVTPASDIITGTDSCTTAAGCQDSHATCIVGTGCKCNDGYQLKQDKSGCEAKSGTGSGTGSGSGSTSGNSESDSDDSSSFLKYSLLAVLSLLF